MADSGSAAQREAPAAPAAAAASEPAPAASTAQPGPPGFELVAAGNAPPLPPPPAELLPQNTLARLERSAAEQEHRRRQREAAAAAAAAAAAEPPECEPPSAPPGSPRTDLPPRPLGKAAAAAARDQAKVERRRKQLEQLAVDLSGGDGEPIPEVSPPRHGIRHKGRPVPPAPAPAATAQPAAGSRAAAGSAPERADVHAVSSPLDTPAAAMELVVAPAGHRAAAGSSQAPLRTATGLQSAPQPAEPAAAAAGSPPPPTRPEAYRPEPHVPRVPAYRAAAADRTLAAVEAAAAAVLVARPAADSGTAFAPRPLGGGPRAPRLVASSLTEALAPLNDAPLEEDPSGALRVQRISPPPSSKKPARPERPLRQQAAPGGRAVRHMGGRVEQRGPRDGGNPPPDVSLPAARDGVAGPSEPSPPLPPPPPYPSPELSLQSSLKPSSTPWLPSTDGTYTPCAPPEPSVGSTEVVTVPLQLAHGAGSVVLGVHVRHGPAEGEAAEGKAAEAESAEGGECAGSTLDHMFDEEDVPFGGGCEPRLVRLGIAAGGALAVSVRFEVLAVPQSAARAEAAGSGAELAAAGTESAAAGTCSTRGAVGDAAVCIPAGPTGEAEAEADPANLSEQLRSIISAPVPNRIRILNRIQGGVLLPESRLLPSAGDPTKPLSRGLAAGVGTTSPTSSSRRASLNSSFNNSRRGSMLRWATPREVDPAEDDEEKEEEAEEEDREGERRPKEEDPGVNSAAHADPARSTEAAAAAPTLGPRPLRPLPPALGVLWTWIGTMLTKFGPSLSYTLLVYSPEADATCLLGVQSGALDLLWSLPWTEFKLRATAGASDAPPRPPRGSRPHANRQAANRSHVGQMRMLREGREAESHGLPEGTPHVPEALVESFHRQRRESRAGRHVIEPLLPPAASVPLSSALHTTIVKIRSICEQIGAALEKHVAPAPRRPAGRLLPSASVGALGQGQRMPAPAPRARGAGGRYFYALDTLQNPSGPAAAFKEVPEIKPLKAVRSLPMF